MPADRISQHLLHAGIVVVNLEAAMRFASKF